MGRLVVEEVLPGGVWELPFTVETDGVSEAVSPPGLDVRFEPKFPNPLNREFIKSGGGDIENGMV